MYFSEEHIDDYQNVEVEKNYQMHGQASQDSIHGPGRDLRGNKRPQDPTMYGQICGSKCLMQQKFSKTK